MQLIIKNINKSFKEKEVLKDLSFTFEQGKIYALLGRNGVGKTTLFNIIANELDKDYGSIQILDENNKLRNIEYTDIFLMVAEPILPKFLTGYEFIKFFMEANHKNIDNIDQLFDEIELNLQDRHRLINSYSTGMKNKLQMMMFIILKPKIILMDEPLTSLDVIMQLQIKKLIKTMQHNHIMIFSTHILQLAKDLCDDIVILNDKSLNYVNINNADENFENEIIEILKS